MGPGRRMKKQGPPLNLEQLNLSIKRKANEPSRLREQSAKRRKADKSDGLPAETPAAKLRNGSEGKRLNAAPQFLPTDDTHLEDEGSDGVAPLPEYLGDLGNERVDDSSLSFTDSGERDDMELQDDSQDSALASDLGQSGPASLLEDKDDSDMEVKLTAANIEGMSRKLDGEQATIDARAQQELRDAAMQTNIVEGEGADSGDGAAQGPRPDLQLLRSRITDTIRILGDFPRRADKTKSRVDYTSLFLSDISTYYGYNPYLAEKLLSLFTPLEAFAFFEANESPRPVVLRTNTLRTNRRALAQALINRGVVLEPVGKWSKVGLQVFESSVPLGATPEYLAGHYLIQAASSFLPVMALAPQPHERVLDMAAAPGGKATYMSALMRNTGAIFANDADRRRAKGLIGNVHRLGCKNTIVSNLDAKRAFPKILGGFDRVLLDAPCSGTGVIGKDPSVKTSKTERDFLSLPHMQKQLLLAAIDSTDHTSKTGGYIVYSTCSVTVEENEGVVQYVLGKRPNIKIVHTGLDSFGSKGFKNYMSKRFDERMSLARRYFPHRENVDGFFVCKLKKMGPSASRTAAAERASPSSMATSETGLLVREVKETPDFTPVDNTHFGGFDSEEDEKHMASAKRKRLKKRGMDPKLAFKQRSAVSERRWAAPE